MSVKRYLPAAVNIAQGFADILVKQGLDPCICCYFLTETERGDVWLFVTMQENSLDHLESYISSGVLSHLSEAFHGHLVTYSQTDGLRYAVLLSPSRNFYLESRTLRNYA